MDVKLNFHSYEKAAISAALTLSSIGSAIGTLTIASTTAKIALTTAAIFLSLLSIGSFSAGLLSKNDKAKDRETYYENLKKHISIIMKGTFFFTIEIIAEAIMEHFAEKTLDYAMGKRKTTILHESF